MRTGAEADINTAWDSFRRAHQNRLMQDFSQYPSILGNIVEKKVFQHLTLFVKFTI